MFKNKKIVAVTPAGRQRYLEILYQYIKRDHDSGIIDQWNLWLNTTNKQDIQWCEQMSLSHDWIKIEKSSLPVDNNFFGKTIYQFFKTCIAEDTIYVRFDDDIVWMEEGAVEELVSFRINNPQYFVVFGNIINNSICSHLHQRFGLLPAIEIGKLVGYECMDDVGWNSPTFAEHTHRFFLSNFDRLDDYKFSRWELYHIERFSINVMCWAGAEWAKFGGTIGWDEEFEICGPMPRRLGTCNCINGKALFAHYAFYPQRNHLDTTDILEKYRQLSVS